MPSNTCCGVEFSGSFDAALAALNETAATIASLVRQTLTFFAFITPYSNQDRSGDSNRPLVRQLGALNFSANLYPARRSCEFLARTTRRQVRLKSFRCLQRPLRSRGRRELLSIPIRARQIHSMCR